MYRVKILLTILLFILACGYTLAQTHTTLQPIMCKASLTVSGTRVLNNYGSIAGRNASLSDFKVNYIAFPPDAQAAVERAINIWETLVRSPIPINIEATWSSELPAQTLASSGATSIFNNFGNAPFRNVWYVAPLAEALAGTNLNEDQPDIKISFNNTLRWHTGIDPSSDSLAYDLTTIALHEIAHGLGITSSMKVVDGRGSWGQNGLAYIYDLYLQDPTPQKLVDPANVGNPSISLRDLLTSDQLVFEITEPTYVLDLPRISSERTFTKGFSISHLDEQEYPSGNQNSLMTPELGRDEVVHDPGLLTLYILQQMGWVIPAINQGKPLATEEEKFKPILFPNPCSGTGTTLHIPITQESEYTHYEIYNIHGQQIRSSKLTPGGTTTIHTEQLQATQYNIRVYGNDQIKWLKLVKI